VTPLQNEQILDFDGLADQSRGIERLGILRMDVDNLGKIFSLGIPDATISRIATVSSLMQLFFEGWVHRVAEEFPNKIYAIYSGGDDLFFVGAWDAVVECAWKIQEDFRKFTGNERVTLSAGIAVVDKKFPLYQAARNAGAALERAKARDGKNSISFLGKELSWSEFARAKELMRKLLGLLDGREGKAVSRSVLVKLSNVYALFSKYPKRPKWAIRLVYDMTRLGEAHKDFKDELQSIQMMIGKEGLIGFLDVPVRWAEMLTMKPKEGGRS
jgi:CRISPR-associated protein Csm1